MNPDTRRTQPPISPIERSQSRAGVHGSVPARSWITPLTVTRGVWLVAMA